MLRKITEYGFYILVFLLPLQTRLILRSGHISGAYFEYGSLSLYGTDLFLLFLLFLFLLFNKNKKNQTEGHCELSAKNVFGRTNAAWLFLGGLELVIFISIFFADEKLIAVYKYVSFLLGIGIFYLVKSGAFNQTKIIVGFLLAAFFQAMLAIWQFLSQSAFACKWLGLAAHDPAVLGTAVIEIIGADGIGERWLRAYGGLEHPNILGGYLAIGILFMIFLIIKNKQNLQENHRYLLLISYLFLLTFTMALFFSFSRSAWLACAVGIAAMLIGVIIKKDWFFQKEILKIILFAGILVFILLVNFNDLVLTRMKAQARLEKKSSIERLVSYKDSYSIIRNNFFFGAGIGNYTPALVKIHPDEPAYFYQPVHNVFLLVMAELGIFGIIFFIGFFLYLFIILLKNKDSGFLGILLALLILLLFDHYFWSLHFGIFFLFFISGLLIANTDKNKALA